MRCFEKFTNDRTCDMCKLVNNEIYSQCKTIHEEKIELNRKLNKIKSECKYRNDCYDEYTPFDGCNKDGRGIGRFAENCRPTLECEKYTLSNK